MTPLLPPFSRGARMDGTITQAVRGVQVVVALANMFLPLLTSSHGGLRGKAMGVPDLLQRIPGVEIYAYHAWFLVCF